MKAIKYRGLWDNALPKTFEEMLCDKNLQEGDCFPPNNDEILENYPFFSIKLQTGKTFREHFVSSCRSLIKSILGRYLDTTHGIQFMLG